MNDHREVQGPPELEMFDCDHCGKPVETLWAAGHRGMLSSEDSVLIGDCIFHVACWDEWFEDPTEMPQLP